MKLDRTAWIAHLEAIAEDLPPSGPPVFTLLDWLRSMPARSHPGRSSRDLDVWQPASDFDRMELKRAVETAALLFDPRDQLDPDRPYVQIITPGPSQTAHFTPVLWARMGRLHIYLPPWPNLIASKLARGDERDVEDVLFLASRHRVTPESVKTCAEAMPEPAREQVLENLIYLQILQP